MNTRSSSNSGQRQEARSSHGSHSSLLIFYACFLYVRSWPGADIDNPARQAWNHLSTETTMSETLNKEFKRGADKAAAIADATVDDGVGDATFPIPPEVPGKGN